jgi:hypothetical protein
MAVLSWRWGYEDIWMAVLSEVRVWGYEGIWMAVLCGGLEDMRIWGHLDSSFMWRGEDMRTFWWQS